MLPNPLPRLADDPTGAGLGLRLPAGSLVDATDDGPWHEPLLWYGDGPAESGTWSELLAARAVGLQPLLVETGRATPGGPADWELMPGRTSYPGDHDAEEVLAEYLEYLAEDEAEAAATAAGTAGEPTAAAGGAAWPGLTPAAAVAADAADAAETADTADPDTVAAEVIAGLVSDGELDKPHPALVYARRSADIPAAIGWSGPVNHEDDVARLCAVLRSWEDRFGIRVVALGFDTLTVTVAAPPRTLAEAEAVAMEHYGFCPDNIDQDSDSLRSYAEGLLEARTWHFWWD